MKFAVMVALCVILPNCGAKNHNLRSQGGESNSAPSDQKPVAAAPDHGEPVIPVQGDAPAPHERIVPLSEQTRSMSASAGGADVSLFLGSFNLLRLGHSKKDMDRLSQIIVDADFHLVAAQEVMTKDSAQDLLDALNSFAGESWEMTLSKTASGESSYKEYFAFYYRDDIVELDHTATHYCKSKKVTGKVQSSCYAHDEKQGTKEAEFERDPFVGHFKIESRKFSVINVHLYYGGSEKEKIAKRIKEALNTKETVDEILAHDPGANVFIAGDFNLEVPSSANSANSKPDLPAEFFVDANGKTIFSALIDEPTTVGFSNFDHIVYPHSNDFKLVDGSDGVAYNFDTDKAKLRKQFKDEVSDHYPIRAEFVWAAN